MSCLYPQLLVRVDVNRSILNAFCFNYNLVEAQVLYTNLMREILSVFTSYQLFWNERCGESEPNCVIEGGFGESSCFSFLDLLNYLL